jgi:hypothetical protein
MEKSKMKFEFDTYNKGTISFIPNIQILTDYYWDYRKDVKKYFLRIEFAWIKWWIGIQLFNNDE